MFRRLGWVSMDRLLKTREVADALGVSPSTVKRWVDCGALAATRTIGKHRLIRRSEAMAFAAKQADVSAYLRIAEQDEHDDRSSDIDRLVDALKACDASAARLVIASRYPRFRASHLADRLLQPAMERVGLEWETGAIDIHHEHAASRIVETILLDLAHQSRMRASRPAQNASLAPLAIGAAPESCLYTLSGILCELTLADMGFRVVNLGCNLPLSSLAKAALAHRPQLIWLSVNHLDDEDLFVADYEKFFDAISDLDCAVALGGRALAPSVRTRLTYASFCDRMIHFEEFAKRVFARMVGPSDAVEGSSLIGPTPVG